MYVIPTRNQQVSFNPYQVPTLGRRDLSPSSYENNNLQGENNNGVIGAPPIPNGSWVQANGSAWTGNDVWVAPTQ
jgi:hypothetical protein